MAVSATSLPILGAPVLTIRQFEAYFTKRNPAAVWLVRLYYDLAPKWGIRPDVLLCQMVHETGAATSWWSAAPRFNMAGVGCTGATKPTRPATGVWSYDPIRKLWLEGISSRNQVEGVDLHFGHMCAYAYFDYRQDAHDADPSRYDLARSNRIAHNRPIATSVAQLSGVWAVPGIGYGDKIVAVYNEVAVFPR